MTMLHLGSRKLQPVSLRPPAVSEFVEWLQRYGLPPTAALFAIQVNRQLLEQDCHPQAMSPPQRTFAHTALQHCISVSRTGHRLSVIGKIR